MGRRALRKIDPELDLSRHFGSVEQAPRPFHTPECFDRAAPLEVEIGSGKGLFLANAALARPEHNFVGVEVAFKYARYTAARLAKLGLTNAVSLHGDGLAFMNEAIEDNSLRAFHVYFPDPWWKKRHRRRRVMNERLLADVVRTLEPGGKLHFWTDVKEYFDESLDLIARETPLEGPLTIAERPAEHHLDYLSHFERRTRLNEEPVYRSEFVKPLKSQVGQAHSAEEPSGVATDS
ncbi:MAG: tRNA (guanosine(46)-N7)-methyltransferase TrmB [Planctomycetota bacterium]